MFSLFGVRDLIFLNASDISNIRTNILALSKTLIISFDNLLVLKFSSLFLSLGLVLLCPLKLNKNCGRFVGSQAGAKDFHLKLSS